ncbi:MAG: hypothetical protein ACR2GG_11415 [Gemmatimonadaceae bacterium]
MSASTGRRRAEKAPSTGALRGALLRVLGIVLAGVAWLLLVIAAIDFGRAARDGQGTAGWAFTVAATAGAAACLLLVFVLVAQLGRTLRQRERYEPGRHR